MLIPLLGPFSPIYHLYLLGHVSWFFSVDAFMTVLFSLDTALQQCWSLLAFLFPRLKASLAQSFSDFVSLLYLAYPTCVMDVTSLSVKHFSPLFLFWGYPWKLSGAIVALDSGISLGRCGIESSWPLARQMLYPLYPLYYCSSPYAPPYSIQGTSGAIWSSVEKHCFKLSKYGLLRRYICCM